MMKTPLPPPFPLAELRERVIASLVDMGDERRRSTILALAGGLADPQYRSWEYYFRAEPVPEGLTRGLVVCGAKRSRCDGPTHAFHDEGWDTPNV